MSLLRRLFSGSSPKNARGTPQIFLTNTLTSKKELFVPLKPGKTLLYSCGPTVYGPAHIGNLRSYVFSDTLVRVLEAAGYRVQRVINITDVGHLVSDEDDGEDKMAIGAAREHTSPAAIADRYTKRFVDDLHALNIDTEEIRFPRATQYIREQIALAQTLEQKGFAYRIADGLYFDTGKFPGYGKLGNFSSADLEAGARVAVAHGKRHPTDFALWRAAKLHDLQQWDSPWGKGNPGWHLECSAMSRSLLGTEIDIHTGGEDHIQVHHNNEIAQSEAASGRRFVRYWMHNAFLTMNGEKASKSLGNVVYLSDITEKGFDPLALRYFYLQAHYRTPLSFSWAALEAAQSALDTLRRITADIGAESNRKSTHSEARERFLAAMRDDLATPQALSILWESLRSEEYHPREKWGLILDAEAHLGLALDIPNAYGVVALEDAPERVRALLREREAARAEKDYARADNLRAEIAAEGFTVEDRPGGTELSKKS